MGKKIQFLSFCSYCEELLLSKCHISTLELFVVDNIKGVELGLQYLNIMGWRNAVVTAASLVMDSKE